MLDPDKLTELPEHPLKKVDQLHVKDLAKKMFFEGYTGDPVVTVGDNFGIVDGRHRVLASRQNGNLIPVLNISFDQYETALRAIPIPSLEDIANRFLLNEVAAGEPARPTAAVSAADVQKERQKTAQQRMQQSAHSKRMAFGSAGKQRTAMSAGKARTAWGSQAAQRRQQATKMAQAKSVVSSRMAGLLGKLED